MQTEDFSVLLKKGISAAEKGSFETAQVYLDQAAAIRRTPVLISYQAYCLGCGQRRLQAAAKLCNEALKAEVSNPLHYLIMGRILTCSGQKEKAIAAYRQGLKVGPSPAIIRELKQMGMRKPVVFKSLDRDHLLNRTLGKLFSRIGLR